MARQVIDYLLVFSGHDQNAGHETLLGKVCDWLLRSQLHVFEYDRWI